MSTPTSNRVQEPSADRCERLRARHPRFVYEGFSLEAAQAALKAEFRFRIEPDIEFRPQTVIEEVDEDRLARIPQAVVENLFFHIGLVEMLSYWKAACSPEIVVRAGTLDAAQAAWWLDLIRHGMGEYFYVNRIDFRRGDLVRIVSGVGQNQKQIPFDNLRAGSRFVRDDSSEGLDKGKREMEGSRRDLVLTSGGKDSVVTLETLREAGRAFDCLLLNPVAAATRITQQAGCGKAIVIRRSIDPRLLELNAQGYLNGHTPFSALLAFLGVAAATLFGHPTVIVSNERSAEEPAAEFLGEPVNHQYSKSLRFERRFREYARQYLAPQADYFSLLRPLYEVQIARLFARHPRYFSLFRSCNRGMAADAWCGRCPKCLFVYVALYPFLDREQALGIFGDDLLAWEGALPVIQTLLGLDRDKPFECVGTKEEALAALYLCCQRYREQAIELPAALRAVERDVLAKRPDLPQVVERILTARTGEHHIAPELADWVQESFHPPGLGIRNSDPLKENG